jgi:hypothetical protein
MGLVYIIPCESRKEGHMHTYTGKGKFIPHCAILGGLRKQCKYPKFFISNFFLRLDFTWVEKFRITMSDDKVINIKNTYYEMASYFLGINIRVIMTSRKTSVKKKAIHFCIQKSRSLLKTIE